MCDPGVHYTQRVVPYSLFKKHGLSIHYSQCLILVSIIHKEWYRYSLFRKHGLGIHCSQCLILVFIIHKEWHWYSLFRRHGLSIHYSQCLIPVFIIHKEWYRYSLFRKHGLSIHYMSCTVLTFQNAQHVLIPYSIHYSQNVVLASIHYFASTLHCRLHKNAWYSLCTVFIMIRPQYINWPKFLSLYSLFVIFIIYHTQLHQM